MRRAVEILVISTTESGLQGLVRGLQQHEHLVDVVDDMEAAGELFLSRGGHDLLLLDPQLAPNKGLATVQRLREIDPNLPVLVFGSDALRESGLGNLHRIHSFHPDSRAGLGAVQKLCCGLPG